ncbi:O-antigen ligase family protein [Vibrio genomosp. F10]|uniref:O-antigen ligase family protein n=1 Tax=Vibrio genomosp. F10 TaxID=723171 RepID=UPI00030514D4|nr:O-antigen ligase family protein [Vibrio genomosp. F10]OEF01330.1 hypothetical protein A1QK_11070 [Vibrio genomosp. F10 str. 9ZD137]
MLISTSWKEKTLSFFQYLPLIYMLVFMHFNGKGDMLFVAFVILFSIFSLLFSGVSVLAENIRENYWLWVVMIFGGWLSIIYIINGADSGFIRSLFSSVIYILFFNCDRIKIKQMAILLFLASLSFIYYVFSYNIGVERGYWEVNAIPLAYNFSVVAILTLFFLISSKRFSLTGFLLLLTVIFIFASIFGAQSRGPIVAISAVVTFGFIFLYRATLNKNYLFIFLSLSLVLTVSYVIFPDIFFRIINTYSELKSIFSGDLNTSIGYRLQLWKVGSELLGNMPWYGYGKNGLLEALSVINQDERMSQTVYFLAKQHFHNGYLDILVRYGYIGISLFFSILVLPIIMYRSENVKFLLIFSLCILQFIVNLSEYNNIHPQSVIYFVVPLGVAILMIRRKNENRILH